MRKILPMTLLVATMSLPAYGQEARTVSMADLGRVLARAEPAAPDAARPAEAARVTEVLREPIAEGVARYRFDLRIGAGEHDVITLHRVVRERFPWVPVRAPAGVMLAHGDAWGFDPTFLASLLTDDVPDTQSIAFYLAAEGLDVWGLDFRWARVPTGTEDFAFMADWGYGTSVADLDAALGVARLVRLATGSGIGRMALLGFSRGGHIGWSLLGEEAAQHPLLRNVDAFVAVDHTFKTDDEPLRQSGCATEASVQALIDAGTFASDFGVTAQIGDLALTAPNDPSPFFPALSNADLAEWAGADPAGGAIPALHSVGGIVDPITFETELLHSQPAHWFTFLANAAAVQPLAINRDGGAVLCDQTVAPFDDHLGDIEVPILYVGTLGGFGAFGIHTTTLVGSSDVSTLLIDVPPSPEQGFGHNDLFLAEDAEPLVWQPIRDWLLDR